ncbi:MAG: RecBCD enzyme subunit RecC [Chlamydiia bacterium]|nr:RecBCD enzyme subunit RecC [Chlamydiia bacterium]
MSDFFKQTMTCYSSNSFNALSKKCVENIASQSHEAKTYFAYPSNEAKEFFIQSFLSKNLSIFGIRFITIQQFIHLILKICHKTDLLFPSHYELMFFLEEKITLLLNSNDEIAKPLKDYIQNEPERIIPLASNLSHVFLDYMLYGKDALAEWGAKQGWQQYLFKQVKDTWVNIIDAIEDCPPPPFPLSLHIFCVDQIPKIYLDFIEKLKDHISFHFYLFSPSPLFWGDLISRKKSAYLDSLFQKQKVSLDERLEFARLADENHPLLAHFVDAGKPLYLYFSETKMDEEYKDIKLQSDLSYIQKAILHQIKPETPPFKDETFSIHSCPSLLREIEVLITNILSTLQKFPDLTPSDITVLAPDIDIYYPFIAYLFADKNLPFSFTVSNLQKTKHNPCLDALKQLFSLIGSRFEKDDILKLFKTSFFGRRCQIGSDDIQILEKIISYTGIRWGFNTSSKGQILDKQDPCPHGLFEKGFSHILDLISEQDSPIEFSQTESIGDLIFLIKSLHDDVSEIKSKSRTLHEWVDLSISFAEKYLWIDEEEEFFKELRKISSLSKTSTFKYSFESFNRLYLEIFSKKGAKESTYEKPIITFSSMESTPPINKTLFFIGLDEENYPKKETIRSLNELTKHPLYEKKQSFSAKARFYLLRAIISSKEALFFSFTSNNPKDGRARNHSPLLEEIIHALKLPIPKKHPFTPYAPSYFAKPHLLQNHFDLYHASTLPFAPPFSFTKTTHEELEKITIDIKELSLLSHSPSAFFFNLSANMYENKFLTPTSMDDSEFVLSYLDRAIITKKQIKEEKTDLSHLTKTNKLPTALFEKAAKKELFFNINEEKSLLKTLFHTPDPYITLQLDPNIFEPLTKDQTTFLPAIFFHMANKTYQIKGSIPNLTEKGFISFKKSTPSEIWKVLPSLIILSFLQTSIPARITFLNEGEIKDFDKERLKKLLPALLSYYNKALDDISPLIPEAVNEYQSKNTIAFAALKDKLLNRFSDPYLEKKDAKNYLHFESELKELISVFEGDEDARV